MWSTPSDYCDATKRTRPSISGRTGGTHCCFDGVANNSVGVPNEAWLRTVTVLSSEHFPLAQKATRKNCAFPLSCGEKLSSQEFLSRLGARHRPRRARREPQPRSGFTFEGIQTAVPEVAI